MSTTARILYVTHSVSRQGGGISSAVSRLSQSVAGHGWETRVFGLTDADTANDRAIWGDVKVRTFPVIGPHRLGHASGLGAALEKSAGAGTIVHLHGLWKWTSLAVLRASRATHTPRVVSPHGMLDRWALARSVAQKRVAWWLYEAANLRGADCLHALCEAEVAQIRDAGLTNAVAVIPNGVDLPPAAPSAGCEAVEAVVHGRRVLLFLSRIHPKKGLIPLMHAWAACGTRHGDWVLAIAGPDEGGHEAEVRRLVTSLGVEDSVLFVGPQYGPAKAAWLAVSSAFVLPSFSEGFPMAILEAMAYGLPVVMTPACNFPEAQAAGSAIAATPAPESLVEAIERLTALSDTERRAMGARGRELAAREYAWDRIAGRMIRLYGWLLERGAMPGEVIREGR